MSGDEEVFMTLGLNIDTNQVSVLGFAASFVQGVRDGKARSSVDGHWPIRRTFKVCDNWGDAISRWLRLSGVSADDVPELVRSVGIALLPMVRNSA